MKKQNSHSDVVRSGGGRRTALAAASCATAAATASRDHESRGRTHEVHALVVRLNAAVTWYLPDAAPAIVALP